MHDLRIWLTLASVVFLIAVAVARGGSFDNGLMHSQLPRRTMAEVLTAIALIFSGITAVSGVYFGWREDRRKAAESALTVQELQLKVAELERARKLH